MRKRVTRWIAVVMIGAMLVSSVEVGTVQAADNNTVVTEENDQPEVPQDTQIPSDVENSNTEETVPETPDANINNDSGVNSENTDSTNDESSEDMTEPEKSESTEQTETNVDVLESDAEIEETIEEVEEIEAALNYLYINEAEQEEGATQNMVLSWGNANSNVKSASIVVENESGNAITLEPINRISETFLYEHAFSKGVYRISKINIITESSEKEFTTEELGISANFGVGKSSNESEKSNYMEMESVNTSGESGAAVEAAVATIGEDGEVTAEASIESAMAAQGVKKASTGKKARSAKASNIVIVLDPGHDNKHTGATGHGVKEEVATLSIAKYCKAELEQYSGVTVYLTRETAACPYPNSSSSPADIRQRTAWAKTKGADVFVSFHLNSFTNSSAHGAEVYYPSSSSAGKTLAQQIQNQLVALGLTDRGVKANDSLAVINSSMANGFPGVLIEHAFVSNSSDANNHLTTEAGLKRLGVADATGIAKYFGLSKGVWVQDGNGWKYKVNGQFVKSQWMSINGERYYFDRNGYRVTGLQYVGTERYYFNTDGSMLMSSWKEIGGKKYYFTNTGNAAKGLQYVGADRYYFNADGSMLISSWKEIEGNRYYFRSTGDAAVGLQYVGVDRYYFNADGSMLVSSWKEVSGKKYYFRSTGDAAIGLQYVGSQRYYFNVDGSMLVSSWKEVEGKQYYFRSTGDAAIGLQYVGVKRHYFNVDGSMLVSSWKEVEGDKYYFGTDGRAIMSSWEKIGGKKYYFRNTGAVAKGLQYVGTDRYYFNADGSMLISSWKEVEEERYYFCSTGEAVTGIYQISGSTYYFSTDGSMLVSSWKEVSGKKYYFRNTGDAAIGLQYVGSQRYYFNVDGSMLVSSWKEVEGKKYYFRSTGDAAIGLQYVGVKRYYFNTDGSMLVSSWKEVEGKTYYFTSIGNAIVGLQYIGDKRYYFNVDGSMLVSSWKEVEGKTYYFTSTGNAAVGICYVGNIQYYFNEKTGELIEKYEPLYTIIGSSGITAKQLVELYLDSGKVYPSYYRNSDAPTIERFCQMYYEEATVEGVKPEVAFCQAMLETSWLRFGGDVKIEQYNFAGIGATGNGAPGNSFKSVREGIRAQIQHLKAYAVKGITEKDLVYPCVDPRFKWVNKGCAPYVEWLGIQENPSGNGWAGSKNYGYIILDIIRRL